MSIFTTIRDGVEYPFEQAWEHIKPVFITDIEPVLKPFLQLFASHEGKLILTTAIGMAAGIATDGFGSVTGAVIKAVVAQSAIIAAQDAETTLKQVQSALQIAKVSQNITTPADQSILTSATSTN